MEVETGREFLGEHHRGVLATRRADGGIQQSPVIVTVDGAGRAIISSRETAYKVRNLRRDPWAQACVFTDESLSLPEAMEPLIDYYKRFPDDNPDWGE